jgi:hypothetical protein
MHDLAGGQADTWQSGPPIEWLAKIARPPTHSGAGGQELGEPKLPSLGAIREDDEHAGTPQASKAHLVGVPTSAPLSYSHRKALRAFSFVWELLPCSVQSSYHLFSTVTVLLSTVLTVQQTHEQQRQSAATMPALPEPSVSRPAESMGSPPLYASSMPASTALTFMADTRNGVNPLLHALQKSPAVRLPGPKYKLFVTKQRHR